MMRLRLLTATLLATLLTAPAWAGDDDRRGHRLDYIFNQLELTEEQRTQVQDIMKTVMEERREDMRARRQSGEGRPSREEMQALREEHRAELANRLNAVLTGEQVNELTTYLEAHRPRHHHRDHRGHHGKWEGKRAPSSEEATEE